MSGVNGSAPATEAMQAEVAALDSVANMVDAYATARAFVRDGLLVPAEVAATVLRQYRGLICIRQSELMAARAAHDAEIVAKAFPHE